MVNGITIKNFKNSKIYFCGALFLFFLVFISEGECLQIISYLPSNGTYISGGRAYNFSINVSLLVSNFSSFENLSALLHFGSQDVWPGNRSVYNMSCSLINSTTANCFREIEIVAAESGTKEYYYFEVSDRNETTFLGNETNPLAVIIDRQPPIVNALNFVNGSFISSNKIIELSIIDLLSGLDNSSVLAYYVKDNATFLANITQNITWKMKINTSEFQNNDSILIYVNASDILGNKNTTFLGIAFIDNEIPEINNISLSEGEEIRGLVNITLRIKERYSGIDYSEMKINNNKYTMECKNVSEDDYLCSFIFNTTIFSDGNYYIYFLASDKANNTIRTTLSIKINNQRPFVQIISPSHAKGIVTINATLSGRRDIIEEVILRFMEKDYKMNCYNEFSYCSHLLNTTNISDGAYIIKVIVKNSLNYSVIDEKSIIIDNTPPSVLTTADYSQIYLKGNHSAVVYYVDEWGLKEDSFFIKVLNKEIKMDCISVLQGRRFSCTGNLDTTTLGDGENEIFFVGEDLAGNVANRSVKIRVDNKPPELISFYVYPTYSSSPRVFNFTAIMKDDGSDVSFVQILIKGEKNYTLNLKKGSDWHGELHIDSNGSYRIDITSGDINNNTKTIKDVGYFYIGKLICGNKICENEENYCLCKDDCPIPKCKENEIIDCSSGIPKCVIKNICGNGICEENENCESCEKDCGRCIKERTEITTTLIITNSTTLQTILQTENENIMEKISSFVSTFLSDNAIIIFAIIIIVIIFAIIISLRKRKRYVPIFYVKGS
jgi:hypothetical protein